jgi:CDP-glucose 4,6-dehydratase
MFADAYSGRRVFLTGHTGFKGAWMTSWLLDLGAQVTGFSLEPPTQPNLFEAIGLNGRGADGPDLAGALTDVRGDVRDRETLTAVLIEAAPEIVIHLAAQPLVRRSYAEPHMTVETNAMGTANVLEAAREACAVGQGPRVIVVVTSDKCYENVETHHAYAESDALGGWDVYSASKACAELIAAAYRRSFFTAPGSPYVATARAGNVVGGGDWGADRIVPDCVRALEAGVPIEVRSPGAVRPWQHVLESLSGYLWLAARVWKDEVSGADASAPDACAWNFGPGEESSCTVEDVVASFLRRWGSGEWRPAVGAERQPHEAGQLRLDATKAARELGWRPAWGVDQAVRATAAWYRCWSGKPGVADLRRRTREDVAAYHASARSLCIPWAG